MRNVDSSGSQPKVRLTFRVGVVGHRPNRLKKEDIPSLSSRFREALSSAKRAAVDFSTSHPGRYSDQPPCLRAVSPLAEGTDRYYAREALRLGYELYCPLPFRKEEFENDFKPGKSLETGLHSVADFNRILNEARETTGLILVELDGLRADSAGAYAAAGEAVLNQSDLLIVVWDGGGGNKRGGTVETLEAAVALHVPALWIDARAPHPWQLLKRKGDLPVASGERCVPGHHGPLDLTSIVKEILDGHLDASA